MKLTAAVLPVLVPWTVMLISLPLKPPVKLRRGDESSLCVGEKDVVVRKQKHAAGVGDVCGEQNIHRAERQIPRFALQIVRFAHTKCLPFNLTNSCASPKFIDFECCSSNSMTVCAGCENAAVFHVEW